jgi:hypothetical protein
VIPIGHANRNGLHVFAVVYAGGSVRLRGRSKDVWPWLLNPGAG